MSARSDGFNRGAEVWATTAATAATMARRYGYDSERRDVLHDSLVLGSVLRIATDGSLSQQYRDGFLAGIAGGRELREKRP